MPNNFSNGNMFHYKNVIYYYKDISITKEMFRCYARNNMSPTKSRSFHFMKLEGNTLR